MPFDRTFHPDEANQAFTVGRLLETGHYAYRPTDHHGPTLYYAAAPLQRAFGHTTTVSLDGTLLRCTPLVFAVLALVLLGHATFRLLRAQAVPRTLSLFAALVGVALIGSSPFFVFFATDFIQEMLLVAFTALMFWSGVGYWQSLAAEAPRVKPGTWAILFGIGAGLAFATKETSVLSFAALGLVAIPSLVRARPRGVASHAVLSAFAFAITAVTLFSSFGANWQGVSNAFVAAPLSYLGRAAGDSAASEGAAWHIHPWWTYLQWLVCGNSPALRASGTGFSVDSSFANIRPLLHLLLFLLPVCLFASIKRRPSSLLPLVRVFLGVTLYTALLLAFYSAIPYKTPWCALQILVPLLLAVSLGAAVAREILVDAGRARGQSPRTVSFAATFVCLVLLPASVIAFEHVPGLAKICRDPDSSAIPYNYANAHPEVRQLAACVASAISRSNNQTIKQSNNQSNNPLPFIAVALPPADTWPFPWYNRAHEHQTGYWTKFEDLVALEKTGAKPTVVVVPMTEGHLVQPLFPHLKHTKRFYMRPGVRIRVFW